MAARSLIAGIALAFICTFLIAARMSARLAATVDGARQIARGDLTAQLPSGSEDEVGKLIHAMTEMQTALRNAMRETAASARDILGSSKNLNEAVAQMDTSASIQSSAASAIAANVEQLTVSINIVADNTGEAARVAHESDAQAGTGHAAIEQLVQQIGEVANVVRTAADQIAQLKTDSEKISDIVSVIKDIADQTNLLALNAAIEAARAGEAGEVSPSSPTKCASCPNGRPSRPARSRRWSAPSSARPARSSPASAAASNWSTAASPSPVRPATRSPACARWRSASPNWSAMSTAPCANSRPPRPKSAKKIEDIATQAEEASAIAHETSRAAESMASTAHGMEAMVSALRV